MQPLHASTCAPSCPPTPELFSPPPICRTTPPSTHCCCQFIHLLEIHTSYLWLIDTMSTCIRPLYVRHIPMICKSLERLYFPGICSNSRCSGWGSWRRARSSTGPTSTGVPSCPPVRARPMPPSAAAQRLAPRHLSSQRLSRPATMQRDGVACKAVRGPRTRALVNHPSIHPHNHGRVH